MPKMDDIALALRETLISPNVPDSNMEAANVVDALAHIAKGLLAVATAIDKLADAPTP